VVLADNDDAGRNHARGVKTSLAKFGIVAKVVELPGLPEKGDVSDWLRANPGVDLADVSQDLSAIADKPANEAQADEPRKPIRKFTFAELAALFPSLNPPVVGGLFREGETVNIIASPKVGKSWLAYHLGLSIVTGADWLGFPVTRGKVLLIDNELHPQTLAVRIPKVADALELQDDDYRHDLDVWTLRGNLRSLNRLMAEFEQIPWGTYKLIVLDAKYRFGNGESENDNAAETALYNTIDQVADVTGAAVVLVHHSSKGSQSEKRVTDVGAGAGAQSRAADCHIVLREHEDDDIMVLDAAVRSFAPVESVAIKWTFPLWRITGADTSLLKGRKTANEQRQDDRDREGSDLIFKAIDDGSATVREIRRRTGLSKDRCERLVDKLHAEGHLKRETVTVRGNECFAFQVA
jgi:hypothetical protein